MPTSHSDLMTALHALQQSLPHVGKGNTADTGKYKYKYADINDVQDALFPLFKEHGFTWTAAPTVTVNGFVLRYSLTHATGEAVEGDYHLPTGNPQEIGSAITYARRYALCAVTGLAPGGDDDDGAAASRPQKTQDTRTLDLLVDEWILALNDAGSLTELQDVWDRAGKAGVTADPRVVAVKDRQKAALK